MATGYERIVYMKPEIFGERSDQPSRPSDAERFIGLDPVAGTGIPCCRALTRGAAFKPEARVDALDNRLTSKILTTII